MLVVIPLIAAGVVALAGGGSALWLSTPAALLACTTARSRRTGVVAAAGTVALSAAAARLPGSPPLPPVWLIVLVPLASVAVSLAARGRLEREREVHRRSSLTDPLTGIPNRRFLLERIGYEIVRHRRLDHGFVVVMLDLDGFKSLNDRFGHAAGDEMLRDVAAALERVIRAQDTAARLGGDEFCVLAPETTPRGAVQLAERVSAAVTAATGGLETLSATVGTAVFPEDGRSAEELLQVADHRLLAAKRELPGERRYRRAA